MATAHLCIADPGRRRAIAESLGGEGWDIVEHPTGVHVLSAIAEIVEDPSRSTPAPALVVIDAIARGCSGQTIAAGMRELGVQVPVLLVTEAGELRAPNDAPPWRQPSSWLEGAASGATCR